MGSYRSEDEALIGLARQLTDAYREARRREDQDFACDSIAEYLHEYRDDAPSEALLAMLALPLTAETYPLVDEAQTLLAGRGPAVVELLLGAVLGDVYDPKGPAPEHAAEALDLMDRRDAVQGLVEVICGRAGDDVKGAAVDGLVALGSFAEPALAAALSDPRGGEWSRAAIDQIRFDQAHPEGFEVYAAGEADIPDDAGELFGEAVTEDAAEGAGEDGIEGSAEDDLEVLDEDAASPKANSAVQDDEAFEDDPATQPAEPDPRGDVSPSGPADGPDLRRVDEAYDEFLRRYQRESGADSTSS
jgi:hypothetical protein